MRKDLILPMDEDYVGYLSDESRNTGYAESISFPRDRQELIRSLEYCAQKGLQITVQGSRTGVTAGSVPHGGHVVNMSRMNRVLGLRRGDGRFYLRVQPGLTLRELREMLSEKRFDTENWDSESEAALRDFIASGQWFFSPDPTETTASIGGMIACNSSGACSYKYGPVRKHISAVSAVTADGDVIELKRGQRFACDGILELETVQGRKISVKLPSYTLPPVKNASGYWTGESMDAIDILIGSDGTLSVIVEAELELIPAPTVIWAVTAFFRHEPDTVKYVEALRTCGADPAAIEFFDNAALEILRENKPAGALIRPLPEIPIGRTAVYTEFHCRDEDEAWTRLRLTADCIESSGGNLRETWLAKSAGEREGLKLFRHAVPESVNKLIAQRKRRHPGISKLGTDFSVPAGRLGDIMGVYRSGLERTGLQSAIWGHIGDNHVHVNILPSDEREFAEGKKLYGLWAKEVVAMGGAVCAEHGAGKIKVPYIAMMYGEEHVEEMRRVKAAFDPEWRLGVGNVFTKERE
ncbi:MAG: FAD-binding oxidoreductase [Oscillospiraceae bacterium]|nr:FAD-binding oxidoreductase [Oscillospiraceae bacterium]